MSITFDENKIQMLNLLKRMNPQQKLKAKEILLNLKDERHAFSRAIAENKRMGSKLEAQNVELVSEIVKNSMITKSIGCGRSVSKHD